MRRRRGNLLVALLFLAGAAVLLYPSVSNWLALRNHSRAITEYAVSVQSLTAQEAKEQLARAAAYNSALTGEGIGDLFLPGIEAVPTGEYLSILNVGSMIGYVDIPAIQVHLPIYHGTAAEVLRKGVGHLSASAFPTGGTDNHAVLTAHRGLPSARLFTDLNRLELGDRFSVTVLDRMLDYQVEQILVVEPHETEALQPVEGEDYVTLVTCTPYAVNSHRLLVRGSRIHPEAGDVVLSEQQATQARDRGIPTVVWVASGLLVLLLTAWSLRRRRENRRGRS